MRILILTASLNGGAGIAATRLYRDLRKENYDVSICYGEGLKVFIEKDNNRKWICYNFSFFYFYIFNFIFKLTSKGQDSQSYSTSLFKTNLSRKINSLHFDIVHIHWFGHEFLSISDIVRIRAHVVMTLHDAWLIQGLAHLPNSSMIRSLSPNTSEEHRIRKRIISYLDSKTYKNKTFLLKKDVTYISPSLWLSGSFEQSEFGFNNRIHTIANVVDSNFLQQPVESLLANRKSSYGFNIIFTSFNAMQDFNKGFDLFLESLKYLQDIDFKIIILGSDFSGPLSYLKSKIDLLPLTSDVNMIRNTFMSASVCVVPSRIENASQVTIESQLMGTPVVAFKTSGMIELINHRVNGYLANSFDAFDFAKGIRWVFENQNDPGFHKRIIELARSRDINNNSIKSHKLVYEQVTNRA